MRILFAGRFEPDYNRTRILADGLIRLGVAVEMLPLKHHGSAEAAAVARAAAAADVVLVPCFAHRSVPFVRRHGGGKPLVFDPLVSKHQTTVEDYRSAGRWSLDALRCWWRDRTSLRSADLVVADTAQHLAYYRDTYRVPEARLGVVPVGVDEELFAARPLPPAQGGLRLFFYGSFAPLQGVPVIIAAMRLLAGAGHRLRIVGGGFAEDAVRASLAAAPVAGLELVPTVPYESLPAEISGADVCLGIFDTGRKASLVVPNKLFHYAACGRCTVTIDTPALREVFTPGSDVVAVQPGAEAIAAAIRALAADRPRIIAVGAAARAMIERTGTRVAVAARLLVLLRDRLGLRVPALPGEAA